MHCTHTGTLTKPLDYWKSKLSKMFHQVINKTRITLKFYQRWSYSKSNCLFYNDFHHIHQTRPLSKLATDFKPYKQRPSKKNWQLMSLARNSSPFIELKFQCCIRSSRQSVSILLLVTFVTTFNNIHLRLGLLSGFFPSGFPAKMLQ